jgi:hypothetical protein
MNRARRLPMSFLSIVFQRPLSSLSVLLAGAMMLLGLVCRVTGNIYIDELNGIDASTLVMIGILLIRGIVARRHDTDLQAVSIALIGALSFIFAYEALYKISFYLPPKAISPDEVREFIIQVGIGLTVLAGFAHGKFRLSGPSLVLVGIFVAAWIFWLLAGFPQVDDLKTYYPATIHVPFTWNTLYLLSRGTKVVAFLAFYFFYAPLDEST